MTDRRETGLGAGRGRGQGLTRSTGLTAEEEVADGPGLNTAALQAWAANSQSSSIAAGRCRGDSSDEGKKDLGMHNEGRRRILKNAEQKIDRIRGESKEIHVVHQPPLTSEQERGSKILSRIYASRANP